MGFSGALLLRYLLERSCMGIWNEFGGGSCRRWVGAGLTIALGWVYSLDDRENRV